jgi:hypothetical protein
MRISPFVEGQVGAPWHLHDVVHPLLAVEIEIDHAAAD